MTDILDLAALLDKERKRAAKPAETREQRARRRLLGRFHGTLADVWLYAHLLDDAELHWLSIVTEAAKAKGTRKYAPPKRKRVLADGTTEWSDIVEWDGGGPASRFSTSCLEAIQRHSPQLLTPMIEGHGAPALLALPRQQRDTTELATPPDWWDR